jgi:hypothetical protein
VDSKIKPLTEFQRGVITQDSVNQQFVAAHTNGFMLRQFWVPPHGSNKCSVSWEAVVGDVPAERFAPHESPRDRRFSELLKRGARWTVWLDRQARYSVLTDRQASASFSHCVRWSTVGGRAVSVSLSRVRNHNPTTPKMAAMTAALVQNFAPRLIHGDDTRGSSRICERLTIAPATARSLLGNSFQRRRDVGVNQLASLVASTRH